MAFNQLDNYYQGYVKSIGNSKGIIAGISGLAIKGSTSLADACVDRSGNIYVTDKDKHIVLKVTDGGVITVLAGLSGTNGNNGDTTVSCADARFNNPTGITCDKNGDLYVCDTLNHQIRKISNNKVSLVAGKAIPGSGTADGVGNAARFNAPRGICIDYSGILYVADTLNHAVRVIRGGTVSTLAGLKGTSGNAPVWADMTTSVGITGPNARFDSPVGIAVNPNGYVFVSDTNNSVIKRIDPSGNVRIFSGSGVFGRSIPAWPNAKTSTFQYPRYCDITRSEELYVIDYNANGPSRLMVIEREGNTGIIVDWELTGEGPYAAAVACNPAAHLKVILAE